MRRRLSGLDLSLASGRRCAAVNRATLARARNHSHQTKAGNEGDIVKYPAPIAVLNGLIAEHSGPFRYADAFARR
jgi:hypothetical protein